MIPQDFVDQLLSKVDIVDVIGRYVPLKRGGQNYFACCPFHKEKSPSFSVSQAKQFYHCFGCGAHGSAIGFVMEYQGLGFVEAVRLLAEETGSELPKSVVGTNSAASFVQRELKQSLEEMVTSAANYFKQQLKKSPRAIHYLKERGVNGAIAAHFSLGYAPDDWQSLVKLFSSEMSSRLAEAGLSTVRQDGRYYDRFRDRVMFPIRNQRGTIIGFGGRSLGDAEPKYLNSPETPLFHKGNELYGLYEARQAVREKNRVIVVEGYMDVVTLVQFGIDEVVATLGTATSSEQVRKLLRQVDNVYFCFDGDEAGKKAAWRALVNSLPQVTDGKAIYFLFLPAQHDPDSFVRTEGEVAFEKLLEHASIPLSSYLIRELTARVDICVPEGQANLIQQALPLLNQINAPALTYIIKKRLAERLAMQVDELDKLLGKPQRVRFGKREFRLPSESNEPTITPLVHKQIKWLLMNPSWAEDVSVPDSLALSPDIACFATLAEYVQNCKILPSPAQILESFRGTPHEAQINRILQQALQDPEEFMAPEETCRAQFRDGNKKLLDILSKAELERLKHKSQGERLTPEESQLMLKLLAR